MSTAAIPCTEPAEFAAGDSVSWVKNLPTYQVADGWSLLYCFRGNKLKKLDVVSVPDPSGHLLTITAGDSTNFLAGKYSVDGYAVNTGTNPTQRVRIFSGQINITANLQTLDEGVDTRTQERRTLDNINAVLEGRANSTILRSEVEGTRLDRIPFKDLLDLQAIYQVKVRNQEIKLLQAQGRGNGRTIRVNFTRPK